MKIYPVIDLFQILTAFLKFLNVLSFFASNLVFKFFLPYALSSRLTVHFTLLRLPFFASIMTFYLLLIVVKSLLSSFLISLLLLTLSITKSCLIDLLPIMASLALPFLYSSPISHILNNTNISFHLYADDTQLYISFSSSDSSTALSSLSQALDSVYSCLTLNRLSVNPNKTEYLLIGTQQQCSKLTDSSLSFHRIALVPVSMNKYSV